jgi:hypothetical protein
VTSVSTNIYLVVGNIASGDIFTIQQTGTPSNIVVSVSDTSQCLVGSCNQIAFQQNASATTTCLLYSSTTGWKIVAC